MLNALSVDVEDWFQVGAFEKVIAPRRLGDAPAPGRAQYRRVLALFDEAGVKATFFTLGWVAARHPALIRRIAEAGHEIASHGWDHQRVFTMGEATFRADLERARDAIEDAGGRSPTGYRAPSFSIDARTPWAHRCSPSRAMPIRRASRRSATTIMAGAKRRASPGGRSPAPT